MHTTDQEALAARRTKCEIYTRVMGYYRPVSHFNQGKKAEHYGRLHFDEKTSLHGDRTPADQEQEIRASLQEITAPVGVHVACVELITHS